MHLITTIPTPECGLDGSGVITLVRVMCAQEHLPPHICMQTLTHEYQSPLQQGTRGYHNSETLFSTDYQLPKKHSETSPAYSQHHPNTLTPLLNPKHALPKPIIPTWTIKVGKFAQFTDVFICPTNDPI